MGDEKYQQICLWPHRGDVIEAWLEKELAKYPFGEECPEVDIAYSTVNYLLQQYRQRAERGEAFHRENCDGCHCHGFEHRDHCPVGIAWRMKNGPPF